MNRFMFNVEKLKMNNFIKYFWQLIISTSNDTLDVPSLRPWSYWENYEKPRDYKHLVFCYFFWVYLGINILELHTACFYCMPNWGPSGHIETSCRPLAFISNKAFLKIKRSTTSLTVWFSVWFLKKNISLVMFCYLAKFHCLVAFTLWGIEQYV